MLNHVSFLTLCLVLPLKVVKIRVLLYKGYTGSFPPDNNPNSTLKTTQSYFSVILSQHPVYGVAPNLAQIFKVPREWKLTFMILFLLIIIMSKYLFFKYFWLMTKYLQEQGNTHQPQLWPTCVCCLSANVKTMSVNVINISIMLAC